MFLERVFLSVEIDGPVLDKLPHSTKFYNPHHLGLEWFIDSSGREPSSRSTESNKPRPGAKLFKVRSRFL